MLNRRNFLASGFIFPLAALAAADYSLQVQVSYTGAHTVDDAHKIYVTVWDTPDFVKPGADEEPIAVNPVSSKDGVTIFKHLTTNPVYVALVFDPTGKWAADGEPPSGAIMGLYCIQSGVPLAVHLDDSKVTEITAKLDDSFSKP
jgi:hypothetical protein